MRVHELGCKCTNPRAFRTAPTSRRPEATPDNSNPPSINRFRKLFFDFWSQSTPNRIRDTEKHEGGRGQQLQQLLLQQRKQAHQQQQQPQQQRLSHSTRETPRGTNYVLEDLLCCHSFGESRTYRAHVSEVAELNWTKPQLGFPKGCLPWSASLSLVALVVHLSAVLVVCCTCSYASAPFGRLVPKVLRNSGLKLGQGGSFASEPAALRPTA